MDIQKNSSLKNYNTFGVEARCNSFVNLTSTEETQAFVQTTLDKSKPYLAIGKGSNLLFTKDFEGTIIRMQNKGIDVIDQNNKYVWIKVAAGEIWDDFVKWSVENKYAGAENLSLIPGTVGAAPIQNIGAYGVELASIFNALEAIEIDSGKLHRFYLKELQFGYRDSIFKQKLKDKYIITAVILKLNKFPFFKIEYGNIAAELEKMTFENLNIGVIRQAVIQIRTSKLPNPKEMGNAGSFFKNPIVSKEKYENLKQLYPNLVAYPLENELFKLAAGWLIENAGLKGYSKEKVGIHKYQALIIVNLGEASGKEILEFSQDIQQKIMGKYGLLIEREVYLI
jgi:UDP-N-acetylmuramate dehydrogenase